METTDMVEALKLGVSGIFLKHHSAESLMRAIRLAASGEVWLDRKIVQLMANLTPEAGERSFRQSRTRREQQVLDGHFRGRRQVRAAAVVRENRRALTHPIG
jgi:DNA-binding NarL/FixJ family response regulator